MITTKDLKFNFKTFIAQHPSLYPIYWLYPKFRSRLVTSETSICIEGFPRSGNTFAYHAFTYFNPDVKVAHHVHSPVQFIWAQKYDIPCLIMIRNPLDALASLIIVDQELSVKAALKHYITYYRFLLREKEKAVIVDIEIINNKFDEAVQFINQKYNKSYQYQYLDDNLKSRIKDIVEVQNSKADNPENLVAIPTNEKENLKRQVKPEIIKHRLYKKALSLYKEVREHQLNC